MTTNTHSTADDLGMGRAGDEDEIAVPVTEFRALPTGTYQVEFINYERMQTQFGDAIKLQYRVTEGPEADALVDEVCSLKGGRGSKLKSRLGALRGAPYKPGEVLRPRELFGRIAQAYVTVVAIKDDDGTEFQVNRIGDLTPWPGQAQAGPRPSRRRARPGEPPAAPPRPRRRPAGTGWRRAWRSSPRRMTPGGRRCGPRRPRPGRGMTERLVFFVALGACVCGALIAVGVLEYLVWLAERQERGQGR